MLLLILLLLYMPEMQILSILQRTSPSFALKLDITAYPTRELMETDMQNQW